jgi:hypothetical protein
MSATFDYNAFVTAYPEFSNINPTQAGEYFNLATLYFNNNGWPGSLTIAQTLLFLLTAHIAWLFAFRDAQGNPSSTGTIPPPQIVGRISSASQGSISVQTEYETNQNPSASWFLQTRYGAAYWQATAQFRTAVYLPGLQRAARAKVSGVFPSGRFGAFPFR